MSVSDRQKDLRRKKNLFGILSFGIWITTSIVMIILAFKHCFPTPEPTEVGEVLDEALKIFSEEFKAKIMALAITTVIALFGVILIKDKLRVFLWILCVVISSILYSRAGLYVILSLWLVDEYVLRNLYLHYKKKYEIRKEIDY